MSQAEISPIPSNIIYMKNMKPCEIGVIVTEGEHKGEIVMRTSTTSANECGRSFEVMSLSDRGEGNCWKFMRTSWGRVTENNLKVRILPPGTQITITIY